MKEQERKAILLKDKEILVKLESSQETFNGIFRYDVLKKLATIEIKQIRWPGLSLDRIEIDGKTVIIKFLEEK